MWVAFDSKMQTVWCISGLLVLWTNHFGPYCCMCAYEKEALFFANIRTNVECPEKKIPIKRIHLRKRFRELCEQASRAAQVGGAVDKVRVTVSMLINEWT